MIGTPRGVSPAPKSDGEWSRKLQESKKSPKGKTPEKSKVQEKEPPKTLMKGGKGKESEKEEKTKHCDGGERDGDVVLLLPRC